MSLEVWNEDYKFENNKNLEVWSQKKVSFSDHLLTPSLHEARSSSHISSYISSYWHSTSVSKAKPLAPKLHFG